MLNKYKKEFEQFTYHLEEVMEEEEEVEQYNYPRKSSQLANKFKESLKNDLKDQL